MLVRWCCSRRLSGLARRGLMRRKTKATLIANIVSMLQPYRGRNFRTGTVNSNDERVHMTPRDLATVIVTALDARGFRLTKPPTNERTES